MADDDKEMCKKLITVIIRLRDENDKLKREIKLLNNCINELRKMNSKEKEILK